MRTGCLLFLTGVVIFLGDSFDANGFRSMDPVDSDPINTRDASGALARPQHVSFWIHVVWICVNWAVAITSMIICVKAQHMYRARIACVYEPVKAAWARYYDAHCPMTSEAVRRLPDERERALHYMLYGFVYARRPRPLMPFPCPSIACSIGSSPCTLSHTHIL